MIGREDVPGRFTGGSSAEEPAVVYDISLVPVRSTAPVPESRHGDVDDFPETALFRTGTNTPARRARGSNNGTAFAREPPKAGRLRHEPDGGV